MNEEQHKSTQTNPMVAWVPIILAGLLTSALTLAAVRAFSTTFNLMGLYLIFIVPVGAILVGLGAGSGYGIASWKLGTPITKGLLAIVVVLQILSYFVAQYVQYHGLIDLIAQEGLDLGFWGYLDLETRAFAFGEGEPLGGIGYAFRVLEIIGFTVGGFIAPMILRSKPYCEQCHRYMKTKQLAFIAASVAAPKLWRKSKESKENHAIATEEAAQEGFDELAEVQSLIAEGNISAVQAKLFDLKEKKSTALKLPARIVLSLNGCTTCGDGFLRAQLLQGQGDQVATSEIANTVAHPDVVKKLLG